MQFERTPVANIAFFFEVVDGGGTGSSSGVNSGGCLSCCDNDFLMQHLFSRTSVVVYHNFADTVFSEANDGGNVF